MKEMQMQYQQVVSVGCAIHVHQNLMVATIRRSDQEYETRSFGGYTSSTI